MSVPDFVSLMRQSQSEPEPTAKSSSPDFVALMKSQPAPEEKKDTRTFGQKVKGGAAQYGVGAAGGGGGIGSDILQLLKRTGLAGIVGSYLIPEDTGPGTHELSKKIEKEFDVDQPVDSMERILRESGQWGGQEGVMGTALGGPAGGGLGLAHGSASGAFYGGLKELGMNDELALGLTMLATVSPVAFQKLMPKIQQKFSGKGKVGGAGEPGGGIGGPPPPPTTKGIETPAGRSGYELAEEALSALQKPAAEPPIGKELPLGDQTVTRPLTGRAKVIDNSVGSEISPDKFYNEKHGGTNISGNVKSEAKLERKPFEKKYKLAEKEYAGKKDIYPKLADENDALIARLEEIPERNPGEEAVYKKAQALRKMVGTRDAYLEAPFASLIKYSDSVSGIANFEMPYTGPKGQLKGMAKSLNNAVMEAAERQGLNTTHMREADSLFSKWADRFLNDEISQYLAHKIRNPEELFRKALSDEGVYRAVRDAIGKKHPKSMDKLDRAVVEVKVRPYVEDIAKVGSPKFKHDMANMEGLLGKDKATKVKNRLQKEQTRPRPKELPKAKSTSIKAEKGFLGETPEKIESMMNSRSGIRELRKELKARGQEELFDKLAEEKTLDILRGGIVSPEKIRGIDMFHQIRQKHNYDILSEIYGKAAIDTLLTDLSKINKKAISMEKLLKLGKYAGTGIGAAKLIKVISIFI